MVEYPGFEARLGKFLSGEIRVEDEGEFKRLLCADCEFFTPGEDEELACSCYKMLSRLIKKGCITLEQLSDALGE